ncbi:hypothetical protein [Gorillibacterium sp. sgz5001074]|uniref:hypothetical protein n=1 Tax=Gorillibacterium sp. sgz5001074 TaxID=3446695 RepID=UPI003F67D433
MKQAKEMVLQFPVQALRQMMGAGVKLRLDAGSIRLVLDPIGMEGTAIWPEDTEIRLAVSRPEGGPAVEAWTAVRQGGGVTLGSEAIRVDMEAIVCGRTFPLGLSDGQALTVEFGGPDGEPEGWELYRYEAEQDVWGRMEGRVSSGGVRAYGIPGSGIYAAMGRADDIGDPLVSAADDRIGWLTEEPADTRCVIR